MGDLLMRRGQLGYEWGLSPLAQGQGCLWSLQPQGHIVVVGVTSVLCMENEDFTPTSSSCCWSPFPHMLREGTGSCWGCDLNQNHRRPSKDAQDNPIISLFSSTPTHGAQAPLKPQHCRRGTADAGDMQPRHRRDRRCLLD